MYKLSAARLNRLFLAGELSAVEIVEAFLSRIGAVDDQVKAFVTVNGEGALERAKKLDSRRKTGDDSLGPLAAVPVALKDNIVTKGLRTTCASKILGDYVPPYDATVVQRLQGAGAIVIGKTNLDEFAMGSSTENSGFFTTRNPWDLERVPGGSSGGSAAAVAACEAPLALGSDTGGSIRQPASYCGVVGLKPTYGTVSRYGLVAFASSLDQIGPIAHDVADAATLFDAISGHDLLDGTSVTKQITVPQLAGDTHLRGLRVGVPKEYFGAGVSDGVRAQVAAAISHLESLGASVAECSLPHTDYALSAYYIIAPAEASANLARFDGVRYGTRAADAKGLLDMYGRTRSEGFGPEVKRRIMLGTYALSSGYYDAYYKKAQQLRTLVLQDFQEAFSQFDVLVTPTAPNPAFRIGEKADPLTMYLEDVCTVPINLAGIPGISVPCGLADGLPVGLQILGPHFSESTLFKVAWAFEKTTEHHKAAPTAVAQ